MRGFRPMLGEPPPEWCAPPSVRRRSAYVLHRLPDWLPRLVLFVNTWRGDPDRKFDHVGFVVDAVEAMTGARMPAEVPIGGPVAWAESLFGPAIDPLRSRPGDIVSFDAGYEKSIALRVGDMGLFPMMAKLTYVPPPSKFAFRSRQDWESAFRVGWEGDR